MEFKLELIHRNISEVDLLNDLLKVSAIVGRKKISTAEYEKYGTYSYPTYRNRFGSWELALSKVGLHQLQFRNVSKEDLIRDLRNVAYKINKNNPSKGEYVQHGLYSFEPFRRVFGTWRSAVKAAGLKERNQNTSIEECFNNLELIWEKLGRQPRISELKKPFSKYSANVYRNKFGNWANTLKAFVDYVNKNNDIQVFKNHPSEKTLSVEEPENRMVIKHKTKREVNWRLRFLVMRRDNFKCKVCGRSPASDIETVLHVDHIKAWIKGGETTFDNLQTLCSKCNLGKGDLDFQE